MKPETTATKDPNLEDIAAQYKAAVAEVDRSRIAAHDAHVENNLAADRYKKAADNAERLKHQLIRVALGMTEDEITQRWQAGNYVPMQEPMRWTSILS